MPVDDPFGPLDLEHGYITSPPSDKNARFGYALLGLFLGLTSSLFLSVCEHSRFGHRPYITLFKVLIWTQLLASIPMFMMEFFNLIGVLDPSFEYFFFDWFLWAIQVHALTQIQTNRVGILMTDAKRRRQIKVAVFCYMMVVVTFSVTSWVPNSLQVKGSAWPIILRPFSLVVSCMIVFIDLCLNIWFVITVRRRLVSLGLTKYKNLVLWNCFTLMGAVSLDSLIVGLMYYEDPRIYILWYPLVYNVKLAVELSLSTLIVRIANEKQVHRLKAGARPGESHTGLTEGSIYVSHEHQEQHAKTDAMEITPAFGQFISRPANWQDTYIVDGKESEKGGSEKGSATYELDTVPRVPVQHAV